MQNIRLMMFNKRIIKLRSCGSLGMEASWITGLDTIKLPEK